MNRRRICAILISLVVALALGGCASTDERQSRWLSGQFPKGTPQRVLEERAVALEIITEQGDRDRKEYRAWLSRPCFVCSTWTEFKYSNQPVEGRFVFDNGRLVSVERASAQ